ncbi:Uncharacterised protein [Moraxella veridica]|nr:Uncharacterised protein [Moraxella catarrhalis]
MSSLDTTCFTYHKSGQYFKLSTVYGENPAKPYKPKDRPIQQFKLYSYIKFLLVKTIK